MATDALDLEGSLAASTVFPGGTKCRTIPSRSDYSGPGGGVADDRLHADDLQHSRLLFQGSQSFWLLLQAYTSGF